MKNSILVLAFLGVFTTLFQSASYALPMKSFRHGLLEMGADSRFVYSDSNYSSGGSVTSLGSNYSMMALNFDIFGRFTYSDWAFSGGATIANAQSKDYTTTRTNSTFSDVHLGLEYKLLDRYVDLIPELQLSFPLAKVNESSDSVINAEYATEIHPILTVQKKFGAHTFFGNAGYNMRDGRSSLLTWGVGSFSSLGTWGLGAELSGYSSIKDDPDRGSYRETSRSVVLNRVNAGSALYYSVNPSAVDLNGRVRLELSRFSKFDFTGGATLAGTNSAAQYHAGVLFVMGFDFAAPFTQPKSYQSPVSTDDLSNVKEETHDGVDQRFFIIKEPSAPQPDPNKDMNSGSLNNSNTSDDYIQKQLDDTEMTIKLKKKKKKK